jgi:predicted acylesterase/phospholipase RssA
MLEKKLSIGLALSGGGSRAAAFHTGTVNALNELGLLEDLDVISSVSGGSIFAAAWMSAKWRGIDLSTFIKSIQHELTLGFITRSIRPRIVKLICPWYTRSNLLAETFDYSLIKGMTLKDLPIHPMLCMNTSVMNTGQVGKFNRDGFSSTGIRPLNQAQASSNPVLTLPDFSVSLAATASAAFPIGLPPVYLKSEKHIPKNWGCADEGTHCRLALTDGGVLENLGVQTLLKSKRFGAWDIVISDAGRKEVGWRPGGVINRLRGVFIGMLSLPILERIIVMMNSKENRHMRQNAFNEFERTWLIDEARSDAAKTLGMAEHLSKQPQRARRRVLFVRLNQTLKDFYSSLPLWRLLELAAQKGISLPSPLPPTEELLPMLGVNLKKALDIHKAMGGDDRVAQLNEVGTSFSGLSSLEVNDLSNHAYWQTYAMYQVYWN